MPVTAQSQQLRANPPIAEDLGCKTICSRLRVGEVVLEARGQGFGHGVGMSQWGAHGLALQGADFRQILLHYYRGAEIRPYRSSDDPTVALRLRSESAWWG